MARLHAIPSKKMTMAVANVQVGYELRAKITSASITVPSTPDTSSLGWTSSDDEPFSLDHPETPYASDMTNQSSVDISYNSNETIAAQSATTKPSRTLITLPKATPSIFDRPVLPPAFLRSYTNDATPSTVEPSTGTQTPAYARPSMSSWYHSPANSTIRGTPNGLPPAGTALWRLSGSRGNRDSSYPSKRPCRSGPRTSACTPGLITTTENDGVSQLSSVRTVVAGVISTVSTSPVTTPMEAADDMKSTGPLSTSLESSLASDTSLLDSKAGEEVKQWFDPEPFLPIDPDFSESENEAEEDTVVPQPKPLREVSSSERENSHEFDEDVSGETLCAPKFRVERAALPETAHHTSVDADVNDSDVAPNVLDSDETSTSFTAYSTRATSTSSHTSQASVEFHMDNTFLGSTSARDMCDHLDSDYDGTITKEELARAWILCVADEHSDRRSVSPGIEAPGVSFITPDDADQALSFHMMRRAKLGRISLLEFLKKFEFDASGKVAMVTLLPNYRQAALESQERSKASRHSAGAEMIRRISRERSSSTQIRGRRSRRSS
jgi:hypothetical protein